MKSQINKLSDLFKILICIILSTNVYSQNDSTFRKEIDEIVISATSIQKKQIVYENSKYYILDYVLNEQGTFLLVNKLQKYYVYSLDSNMNLQSKLLLDFHPKSFFEDCFDQINILAKDSIYRLEKFENNLIIKESHSISLYYNFLKRCIDHNSNALIFKDFEENGEQLVYSQLNNITNKYSKIYTVQDSLSARYDRELKEYMAKKIGYKDDISELNTAELNKIRNDFEETNFYNQILNIPSYDPLFVLNDTIYIFDHLNDKIILYNNKFQKISNFPISYHKNKKWKKEIYLDKEKGLFYSVNIVNGINIFNLLNLKENKIESKTSITKDIYPKKLKVYNGYIYYLYKENVDANLNKLYRVKIHS